MCPYQFDTIEQDGLPGILYATLFDSYLYFSFFRWFFMWKVQFLTDKKRFSFNFIFIDEIHVFFHLICLVCQWQRIRYKQQTKKHCLESLFNIPIEWIHTHTLQTNEMHSVESSENNDENEKIKNKNGNALPKTVNILNNNASRNFGQNHVRALHSQFFLPNSMQ